MFPSSSLSLSRVREPLAARFTSSHRPQVSIHRDASTDEVPFSIRFGLAFFSSIAVIASVTAGAAALYVFWIVSQDFSA